MLASEEFGLGGASFGRGYEPSEITGDHGAAFSAELQYLLPFRNRWLTCASEDRPTRTLSIDCLQAYSFYDVGAVWNENVPAGLSSVESLSSAGLGLRFGVMDYLSVEGELAKPLTRDVASQGDRDWRPLFNLSARY